MSQELVLYDANGRPCGPDEQHQIVAQGTSESSSFLSSVFASTSLSGLTATPLDFSRLADAGYRRNSIIHACIKEIARTTADARPEVLRVLSDGQTIVLDPRQDALANLIAFPNEEQDSFEFFEVLVTHLMVAGNAFIWTPRSPNGQIQSLELIRPDAVGIVEGRNREEGRILAYTVNTRSGQFAISPDDIIQIKLPDALDEFWGLSPLFVLIEVGDIDAKAVQFLRGFFNNRGIPSGILTFETRVDDAVRERIRNLWHQNYQGTEGWHNTAVLDAAVNYQQIATGIDQMDMGNIFGETEARICSVLGVPPIVIGAKVGLDQATYSNYEQAVRSFWQETVVPMYGRLERRLSRMLAQQFSPDHIIKFNLSSVDALQESQTEARSFAVSAWKEGLWTRNEARQLTGQDPVDGGDVFNPRSTAVRAGDTTAPEEQLIPFEVEGIQQAAIGPSEVMQLPGRSISTEVQSVWLGLGKFPTEDEAIRYMLDFDYDPSKMFLNEDAGYWEAPQFRRDLLVEDSIRVINPREDVWLVIGYLAEPFPLTADGDDGGSDPVSDDVDEQGRGRKKEDDDKPNWRREVDAILDAQPGLDGCSNGDIRERHQRFAEEDPDNAPEWQQIHRIADRNIEGFEQAFRDAIDAVKDNIDLSRLQQGIDAASIPEILAAIPFESVADPIVQQQLGEIFTEMYQDVAEALARSTEPPSVVGEGEPVSFTPDASAPVVQRVANAAIGELITDINTQQREAITEVVNSLFEGEVDFINARDLISQTVGLNSKQAQSLAKIVGVLDKAGLSDDEKRTVMDREVQRMLDFRGELIARTETIGFAADAQQTIWQQMLAQGFLEEETTRKFWVVTPDDRLDQRICAPIPALNPDGRRLNEPFVTPIGELRRPTAHPLCYLPNNSIICTDPQSASERPYDGIAVIIRTKGGRELAVTSQHPVLTRDGWLPAEQVKSGCDVVIARPSPAEANDALVPAVVGDLFDSIRKASGMSAIEVPIAAPDFHGDASDGDVAIVYANRLLGDWVEPDVSEAVKQKLLAFIHRPDELFGNRYIETAVSALFGANVGDVSITDLLFTLKTGEAFPGRQGASASLEAMLFQDAAEGLVVVRRTLGDVTKGLPSIIALDEVVDVQHLQYSGKVYSLETESSLVVANSAPGTMTDGVVTSNCRCVLSLAFIGEDGRLLSQRPNFDEDGNPTGLDEEGQEVVRRTKEERGEG